MGGLNEYVESLFAGYGRSRHVNELKAEILSNLEAKKADLTASGLTEAEALKKAMESITSIDFLIEGNRRVYYNQLKLEFVQWSLILILAGWIVTLPLRIFHMRSPAGWILALAAAVVGIYYLVLYQKARHVSGFTKKTKYMSIPRCRKIKKLVWLLWAAFAFISTAAVTALHFGSSIWFSRPVGIHGPYELAVLLTGYFAPLLTVILPAVAGIPLKLVYKYEAGEKDEK